MPIVSVFDEELNSDDTLSVSPADQSPGNITQWYHCNSRIGELDVGIDAGADRLQKMQGPGLLLQQAMLLSEVELTLQAFELWQGLDLDLQPVNSDPEYGVLDIELSDDNFELLITHRSLPEYPATRFRFSKQSLPQLAAINEQLQESLEFQWSALSVVVTLDSLELSESDLVRISAGAMVLLPASFNAPWQVSVSIPGIDGLDFPAQLDPANKVVTLFPAEAGASQFRPEIQSSVQLIDLTFVSPELVLGDVSGTTIKLSTGSAALKAQVTVNDKPLALGAVGAVGRGYALHVSRLLTED